MQSQLMIIYECLQEEIKKKRTAEESGKKELLKQLQGTKKERNIPQPKLSSCIEKMSHFSTHNVNKRLKTKKANVQNLKNKILVIRSQAPGKFDFAIFDLLYRKSLRLLLNLGLA